VDVLELGLQRGDERFPAGLEVVEARESRFRKASTASGSDGLVVIVGRISRERPWPFISKRL
jgi:hypothetical protein